MSTIRHFSGSREQGGKSIAKEILQLEMQKKGKLPAQMRYKLIFKRKQEEAKAKAMQAMAQAGNMKDASGKMVTGRKMSERAEQALKEMAMKKAAKEQKKLRKMVIVQAQNFSNGRIDAKGQIFDLAGNMVGKVNTKNGTMSLNSGWSIGKYKPKSYMTKLLIEQAIDKHSPYFILQRRLQQQAAAMSSVHGGFVDPNVINVQGVSAQMAMLGGGLYGGAGNAAHGVHGPMDDHHHQQSNITAWGAVSNNAWGTFSNNVHGTLGENVHGTVNTDVWGGVGASSMWGQKSVRMYGTGSGVNHLGGLMKYVRALFGIKSKAGREAQRELRAQRMAGGGGGSSAPAPRRR